MLGHYMFKACEVVRCKETESFNRYELSSEASSELKLVISDRNVLWLGVCWLRREKELYGDQETGWPI